MFRKTRELQSLVNERTKALKNAESKIKGLNSLISNQQNEKRTLRKENSVQKDLILKITNLVKANKYNNEKATLNKIKELVHDYQSTN